MPNSCYYYNTLPTSFLPRKEKRKEDNKEDKEVRGGRKRERRLFTFLPIICTLFLLNTPSLLQAAENKSAYERINSYRNTYLTTNKKHLISVLEESSSYRLYVRRALKEAGLPSFLEYLPVVESNYTVTAKSASGALGMWQFMLNSVKPFLICNEYVDERLDPYKSTTAAIRKLKDNYTIFKDWFLAITAYNLGAGALRSAIKKAGKSDFWYLCDKGYLKPQAAAYVPKLLAIADIVTNATAYNIDLPLVDESINPTPYEYLTVNKTVSLRILASYMRIDYEILRRLNLSLIKEVTPPAASFSIRLPEGQKEIAVLSLYEMGYFNTPLPSSNN